MHANGANAHAFFRRSMATGKFQLNSEIWKVGRVFPVKIFPWEMNVSFMTFHSNSPPYWIWPREGNEWNLCQKDYNYFLYPMDVSIAFPDIFVLFVFCFFFLILKENTQQLCACITLLRTLLYIHCATTMWNALLANDGGCENDAGIFLFFLLKIWMSPLVSNYPQKIALAHWARLNKRDRVLKNQNSFLREFFTAVVV